jgi:hypothetical protein
VSSLLSPIRPPSPTTSRPYGASKKPFGGPEQVLAYLRCYTHRVAIANRRLMALDDTHVAFTWKD